ncbi:RNA polymerase recycling motor HelD [Thermicanus aegyptius]|uniref:RNA polymerase recycling motor HelD n=1 Tax=Thermicanus aegyptius TaxID=94009 RepID=UPI00040F27E1|nr:RNA polymerase recycling motor HelD [Thermicanus aegyptius]
MAIDERERLEEEKRVEEVVGKIKRRIQELREATGEEKGKVVTMQEEFWEDLSVNIENPDELFESYADISQQSLVVAEEEKKVKEAFLALERLKKLAHSPYFGRVDFKDAVINEEEKIYIGTSSFLDEETGEFLVYDWRAPISSLFYDHIPGRASYEAPGGVIEGELTKKRQYEIKGGKLQYMFDTGVTIGDEILKEVLGKQAEPVMHSIVASIQREQNRIIRNDNRRVLLVQGVAGSGKTSVALQRIAYLLYKYRNILSSENMLLFSPNPLFKQYVSKVLPELGEANMLQTTLFEYMESRLGKTVLLEHPFTQLEELLEGQPTHAGKEGVYLRHIGIRFKGTHDFYQILTQYANLLKWKGMIFKDLKFRGENLISGEELREQFYQMESRLNISKRMELLSEWALAELDKKEEEMLKEAWVEEEVQLLSTEEYHKAHRYFLRTHKKRHTFDDFKEEEAFLKRLVVKRHLKKYRRRIKERRIVDLPGLYRQLFADDSIWEEASRGILLPAEIGAIRRDTLGRLERNEEWPFEDAPPLLLLKEWVEGFRTYLSIRHVVIDEAQDYSPFHFRWLKQIFPRASFTILGDVYQTMSLHTSIMAPENLRWIEENEKDVERFSMTKSYRSTKEIVEFSRRILGEGKEIEPFERSGEHPRLIRVETRGELAERISSSVTELQKKGVGSIAILCKTEKECDEAEMRLSEWVTLQRIRRDTRTLRRGLLLLPIYLAKGVEFDAVIFYDVSKERYHRELERNLLYTGCMRALHELHLFYVGEPSPFLHEAMLFSSSSR